MVEKTEVSRGPLRISGLLTTIEFPEPFATTVGESLEFCGIQPPDFDT